MQEHRNLFYPVDHFCRVGNNGKIQERLRSLEGVLILWGPEAKPILDPNFPVKESVDVGKYLDFTRWLECANGGKFEWGTGAEEKQARGSKDKQHPPLLEFNPTNVNLCLLQWLQQFTLFRKQLLLQQLLLPQLQLQLHYTTLTTLQQTTTTNKTTNKTTATPTLHYTTLHYTDYIALHYNCKCSCNCNYNYNNYNYHYITLHSTYYTTLHYATLHYTNYTALHYNYIYNYNYNYTTLHILHYITLHYTNFTAPHYNYNYITLH